MPMTLGTSRGSPRRREVVPRGAPRGCAGPTKGGGSGLEQPGLVGQHDRLGAVPQLQLLQQPGHVGLHRGVADEELAPDLGVRVALGDQPEDVHLARSQVRHRPRRLLVRAGELRDHPPGHRRRQQRVTAGHRADGGDQLLRRVVPEDEAARARPPRPVDVLVEIGRRQDQDAALRVGGQDPARGLEPVQLRHPDVHQDHVGVLARGLGDRLEPVARLGHDLDVLLVAQQQPEAGPHHRLVVHDKHPDRHDASLCRGKEARSTKPPVVAVKADISPPYALTRSPMPTNPCPSPSFRAPPTPSSRTSNRRQSGVYAIVTSALRPPECLSALVSPSWTMRYAERSSDRGSVTGSPSTCRRTSRPAARTSFASASRSCRPGPGVSSSRASPSRRAPSRRRISASAVRPACSTLRSASPSFDVAGIRCRTAPTWSTITLTAWATTSWSSRAIRARSSAAANRAADSRSRSARNARSSATSLRSARARSAYPTSQATPKSEVLKTRSRGVSVGSCAMTMAAETRTTASPTRASTADRRPPSNTAAPIPARYTDGWVVISWWSTKLSAALVIHTAAGATSGQRFRPSSSRGMHVAATTSNHSWTPAGLSASSRSSVPTAPPAAARTMRTSKPRAAKNLHTRAMRSRYGRRSPGGVVPK